MDICLIFIYIVSNENTEDKMALDDTAIILSVSSSGGNRHRRMCSPRFAHAETHQKTSREALKRTRNWIPYSQTRWSLHRFKVTKSVQSTDAAHAKDELRILDLEREILGDAIRRLYEAHAEGKINEQERERLASSYKARMMAVKESMAKDETIVALHELEGMQEDLMKLFSERFGELTGKVEELRTRIDVKPVKEIKVQMPKPQIPVVPDQMESEDEEESRRGS